MRNAGQDDRRVIIPVGGVYVLISLSFPSFSHVLPLEGHAIVGEPTKGLFVCVWLFFYRCVLSEALVPRLTHDREMRIAVTTKNKCYEWRIAATAARALCSRGIHTLFGFMFYVVFISFVSCPLNGTLNP